MKIGVYDDLQLLQISHDSAVIDPQELVRRSGHVDILVACPPAFYSQGTAGAC